MLPNLVSDSLLCMKPAKDRMGIDQLPKHLAQRTVVVSHECCPKPQILGLGWRDEGWFQV